MELRDGKKGQFSEVWCISIAENKGRKRGKHQNGKRLQKESETDF